MRTSSRSIRRKSYVDLSDRQIAMITRTEGTGAKGAVVRAVLARHLPHAA